MNCFLNADCLKLYWREWVVNWQDSALGNFAIALLNAVEIRDNSHADAVRRIRTVIQTFEWLEEELIQQMCSVNIQGKGSHEGRLIQRLLKIFRGPQRFVRIQTGRFGINSSVSLHITSGTPMPRMRWEDEVLWFWVPPILHPSVRSLVVTSSSALYGEHLCRVFLGEKTEILPIQPRAWVPGNRVFQIRTDIYTPTGDAFRSQQHLGRSRGV